MCNILKKILKLFGYSLECGEILLVITGEKEIEVDLDFTPTSVWLNLCPTVTMPVCQGAVDSFDVRIVPNGFVIVAQLTSEFREIEWFAVK
jgi:hypothetical protein